ncbi:MAG TPA: (2Fe-2S) ferredoxin domain-containing protein [Thermomicrobiales bacterium]|nr:(2Fe-2S) ferredoxin domain-containing protein [Thermomicrobiales bacterium]
MYWTTRHVLICNASHCTQKGANDVAGRMRLEVIRRKLDTTILINNCGTIDLCDIGPNIVVYPDNIILSGVTLKDVGRVVDYLAGGEIPQDLVLNSTTVAEEERRSFYRAAVDLGIGPEASFLSLAEANGFGAAWINEQLRRGFMARKPLADSEPGMTVTSKAKTRYSI